MSDYNAQPLIPHSAFVALYRLEIHAPDAGGGAAGTFSGGFTFPLTPRSVKKVYTTLGNYYDVQAPFNDPGTGVLRQVDFYGQAPPIYMIEGTTGYQVHNNDGPTGVRFEPGVAAIKTIDNFFNRYAALNAELIAKGEANLFSMRFLDFYRRDFWQVEPLGEQGYFQDDQRPLLVNYRYRLVGVKDLAAAYAGETDFVLAFFAQRVQQVAQINDTTIKALIATYIAVTEQ